MNRQTVMPACRLYHAHGEPYHGHIRAARLNWMLSGAVLPPALRCKFTVKSCPCLTNSANCRHGSVACKGWSAVSGHHRALSRCRCSLLASQRRPLVTRQMASALG